MKNMRYAIIVLLCAICVSSIYAAEYYVNLHANNGDYVWAKEGGGGPPDGTGNPRGRVLASQTYPPNIFANWILRDVNGGALSDGDTVTLRTGANGLFACADNGGGGNVVANRVFDGSWETFTIYKPGGGSIGNADYISLKADNGQYLCAENGGGSYVIANRNNAGTWETFQLQIIGVGGPYWAAPIYNPAYWNDWNTLGVYGIQYNNNCYNYGGNRATWTFAQPGRASGNSSMTKYFSVADISLRLINDGWEPTTAYATSSEGKMKVYVALRPYGGYGLYEDFHFYRQDSGGTTWSHKIAHSVAHNFDSASATITNPETCDRGTYTYGMGYYFVPTLPPQGGGLTNIL